MIYGIAVLSCFCFVLLFRVRDDLVSRKRLLVADLHFERVMEEVLGRFGNVATIAALIFTQMGFATAYIIFIGSNLNLIYPQLTFVEYCLMLIVPLVLLCWIRQLKYIAPVALAGMLAIALAVGVVLYYCISERLAPFGVPEGALLRAPWASLPIAFGVNVYLFEGIGLILPLESKMEKPESFVGIMWAVHISVATMVAAFGLVGYLSFYNCTLGPIINNLPGSGTLVAVTIWGLNVCLVFTYPIQMVPVFQILEDLLLGPSARGERAECCGVRHRILEANPSCARNWRASSKFLAKSLVLRAVVVLVSVGFAVAIPFFDLFLSLIGGLGSAQLMFILPPIAYLVCFRSSISWPMRLACWALLLFGVGTLVVTTVFTVISIVQKFHETAGAANAICTITMQ